MRHYDSVYRNSSDKDDLFLAFIPVVKPLSAIINSVIAQHLVIENAVKTNPDNHISIIWSYLECLSGYFYIWIIHDISLLTSSSQ